VPGDDWLVRFVPACERKHSLGMADCDRVGGAVASLANDGVD
jgi:hypothetical protein